MYTQPKCTVRVLLRRTVELRTAGVQKYRLLQLTVHGVLISWVRSTSRRPGVNCGTVGKIYVHIAQVHCSGATSGNYTDPYSMCTKIQFAAECRVRCGELPLAVSESYTWCALRYRISQVGKICVHTAKVHGLGPT